jgi:hypothetical protein
VQHAGADDLVKHPAEFSNLFDREPMEIKVLQAVFALQIARMAQLTSLMSIAVTFASGSRSAWTAA